jgi:hypothetical protein
VRVPVQSAFTVPVPLSVTFATVPPELLVAVPPRFPPASRVYLATAAKGTATLEGMTEPVSVYAHSPATAAAEQVMEREDSPASDPSVCAYNPCFDPIHSMPAVTSIATVVRVRIDPVMSYFIVVSF